ncbi:helicase HerA domain-containing protein [Sphingobium scionense]
MNIPISNFTRDARVPLGHCSTGPLELDLGKLMSGRCLIQGSSGAGKSQTLRRIIEEAFDYLTTIIVDPEESSPISPRISAPPPWSRATMPMTGSPHSRCARASTGSRCTSISPISNPITASRRRPPFSPGFCQPNANIGRTRCWYASTKRICWHRIWQRPPVMRKPAAWALPR